MGAVERRRFARLNADGTLDQSYGSAEGANNTVYSLVVQPDDNVIVGGDFTVINSVARRGVARLFAQVPSGSIMGIHLASGQARVMVHSEVGRTYALEASRDMLVWQPVMVKTATTTALEMSDSTAPNNDRRFYRVRLIGL